MTHHSAGELDYVLGLRYAICPEPGCSFTIPIPHRDATTLSSLTEDIQTNDESIEDRYQVVIQKPVDINRVKNLLPDDRYCDKHGIELLFYCPHCKLSMFRTPDPVFCTHCAKRIKG